MRRSILYLCIFAACTAAAWASTTPPADVLKVDYFANANTASAPDATVRITDPGTAGGNICAYFAVFDPNQEMSECCGCLLTPDGLRTLSVNVDLTGNPLTGVTLTTGVIKMVSVAPSPGNTCPLPTQVKGTPALEPAIRAWATHIQNANFAITETASQDATLSTAEEGRLAAECYAIVLDGSGKGICTCGTGD
jgi:hypothetical protein